MLELYVLASGSSGNAAVVRDASTGRSLLIDCGTTKRDFMDRSAALGLDPESIEAVLVTHAHVDHTKGLGVVLRGLAARNCKPTLATLAAVRADSKYVGEVSDLVEQMGLALGQQVEFAGMRVTPFPTSHDVSASMGFRIESADDALGYMTDTGEVTPEAHDALSGVRILAIESNHDVIMLRDGPYPYVLQQRILSQTGHLSNAQCCEEVDRLLHPGLEHIVAMHISEHNNTFTMPVRELQALLDARGHSASVQAGLPRTPIKVS